MKIKRTDQPRLRRRLRPAAGLLTALLALAILLGGSSLTLLGAGAILRPAPGLLADAALPVHNGMGQSADQIRFAPWPLYDNLATTHTNSLPPMWSSSSAEDVFAATFAGLGVPLGSSFFSQVLLGVPEHATSPDGMAQYHFVNGAPATLDTGQEIQLFYASSSNQQTHSYSLSYLFSPTQEAELTPQQVAAAQQRVETDLLELLRHHGALADLVASDLLETSVSLSGLGVAPDSWPAENGLAQALCTGYPLPLNEEYFSPGSLLDTLCALLYYQWAYADSLAAQGELEALPLAPLLERLSSYSGFTGQIITMPRQILVLFNLHNTIAIGAYYDIQLGRYCGVGYAV